MQQWEDKKFWGIVSLYWVAQYLFVPYFTPYLTSVGISASVTGIIVGSYGATQLLFRLPIGITGTSVQRQRLFMKAGLLSMVISSMISFSFHSAGAYFISRALAGISAATWVAFTAFALNHYDRASIGKAAGIINTVYNLGVFFAFLFGSLFFSALGIDAFFLLSAVAAGAALLLLFSYGMKPSSEPVNEVERNRVAVILKDRKLLYYSSLGALLQFVVFGTILAFSLNYAASIGAEGRDLGIMSALLMISSMVASSLVGMGLTKNIPGKYLIGGGFFLVLIYCLCFPLCQSMGPILGLQILGGIGRAVATSQIMAHAVENFQGRQRSVAMGAYQSIYSIGLTTGPVAMGILIDFFGNYTAPFEIMAALCAAGVLLSVFQLVK